MCSSDLVMVYKFDPDGHGKIIAEARDPRLESLLGHHYPATDIPQRARELYLRGRFRLWSTVLAADGTPRYTATQSLSPENQKLFDQYATNRSFI